MDRFKLVHPFLFAITPIFFLYWGNASEPPLDSIFRLTFVMTTITLVVLTALVLLLKDGRKAAVIVTLFWVLFFAFGYVLTVLHARGNVEGSGWRFFWHPAIPFFLLGVFFVLAFRVTRTSHAKQLANLASFSSLCLVALQLPDGIRVGFRTAPATLNSTPIRCTAEPLRRPHIFYIILDAYGREDVLRDLYQFDNWDFIEHLKSKGFYVAPQSRSNYCQTYLSLASSLNFDYLDEVARQVGPEADTKAVLGNLIRNNRIARFIREKGYRFVSFSSGVALTEIKNADVFVNRRRFLNEFEYIFLKTTPIGQFAATCRFQESLHRERLHYIFDHLPDYASSRTPLFVFAHILAPHEPFVFDEAGQAVDDTRGGAFGAGMRAGDDYVTKYRRQLRFVTKRIQKTIDDILTLSPEPPIIILQSDHGPVQRPSGEYGNLHERMGILYASHVPHGGGEQLYPGITPVNTFRIVLNQYFHANLPLLRDESFFSTYDRPLKFVDVTKQLR